MNEHKYIVRCCYFLMNFILLCAAIHFLFEGINHIEILKIVISFLSIVFFSMSSHIQWVKFMRVVKKQ